MAPHISKREWFQWEPDKKRKKNRKSEPTDTIVLTSAENRFVDIRIFKDVKPEEKFPGIRPLSQLDWAFAGESSSKQIQGPDGIELTHSIWRHFVDSKSMKPEEVVDEGDMVPTTGDEVIERGEMMNSVEGKVMEYEEGWSTVEMVGTGKEGKVECVVLVVHDDERQERGVVVRVGQWCQGVVRSGEAFALERWLWSSEGGWKRQVRMGDLFLPCGPAMEDGKVELGGEVVYQGQVWKCVELSSH